MRWEGEWINVDNELPDDGEGNLLVAYRHFKEVDHEHVTIGSYENGFFICQYSIQPLHATRWLRIPSLKKA